MPRVNVWVPDELHETVRAQLPELKMSHALQEALRDRLRCDHAQLACRRCAAPVDGTELVDDALGAFYVELLRALEPLVYRVGTAEGAARIAKEVAERFGITVAARLPLPRPSRANRERARDEAFAYAARAMTDRPPRRGT